MWMVYILMFICASWLAVFVVGKYLFPKYY